MQLNKPKHLKHEKKKGSVSFDSTHSAIFIHIMNCI